METGTTSPVDAAPIAQDLFCPDCGYNLRGLTADRCPECGQSIEGLRSQVSQIPWVERKEVGWWRAYWRTVFFVMFRQRRFVEEMARDVGYRDSQSFRWVTVALAYLPLLVANLSIMVHSVQCISDHELIVALCTTWWMGAALHVGYVLFLAVATGAPSYFFHPRAVSVRQQNRAIALSYYACGPLALSFLPTAAWMAAVNWRLDTYTGTLLGLLAVFTTLALFTAWWLDLIHLMKRLLPQQKSRADRIVIVLPLLWIGLGFVLIPSVLLFAGLLALVFASLR